MSAADNAGAARETVLRLVDEALTDLRSWGGANSVMHTKLTAIRYAAVRMPVPAAAPSSCQAEADAPIAKALEAREWLREELVAHECALPQAALDSIAEDLASLIEDERHDAIEECAAVFLAGGTYAGTDARALVLALQKGGAT